ncbi:O-Antigen ligase [Neorhizobium galegae bv. officinalis bv. officinalis str. HAMBI 1141]|uniref:O-Antigen ligase n=1 Tax=Neorhizobium galegae bv. officinalis bv. officinalis str. HAMBI 1141 TaxID=1028801 RepID=A0A068TBA8_NEOGA|nr:O-antigen ligase family protein [Neorhizobium galegae]CDN55728.1 O-Antigen ligase [Neorhizobium galegae bv. officinalis bv. officinalis str. HAMBI 1141]
MPEYLRALLYVLIISAPALYIAGKVAVPLIGEAEFKLWRNCWVIATCATFLSRSFFDFAAALAIMSLYIHRNSKQPVLLYVILMFVAPCVPIGVGIPGVFNRIIDLDPPRLLAVVILLPIAIRLWREHDNRELRGPDVLVIAFFVYISLLALRLGDLNSILRVVPGYFLDILLPYFVFSRSLRSALEINQVLLAFVVAALPLAAIGFFEIWRNWRIYYVVVLQWDVVLITVYLFRDGFLRAATTSVESIAFGFLCMTAGGCLLALRTPKSLGLWRYAALGVLMIGLLSSVSRGPWLGFALCAMVLLLTNLRVSLKLLVGMIPGIATLIFVHPPFIDRFTNLLPFVGSADKGSETYRSRLFENSIIVIERYPLFGSDTFVREPEMQTMIQGQGIVDVVNTYLQISLHYGLIGLLLFAMFFGVLAVKLAALFWTSKSDIVSYEGVLALLAAMLFTIATTSSVSIIPYIYWPFSGLCAALLRRGAGMEWEFFPLARAGMKSMGTGLRYPVMQTSVEVKKMRVLGSRH